MINWCAYCQKFLGEGPPLEDRSFSHGMCSACETVGLSLSEEQSNRLKYLVGLNHRFWAAGQVENHEEMIRLAEEGMSQGIRPIDILFGFAGPLLYKVGELWAKNKITELDEQRFTRSCETLIQLVSDRILQNRNPTLVNSADTVLLTNVEGNIHTLGLHFSRIGLASLGISAKIVLPSLTPEALVDLAIHENFQVIGLSVAQASQSIDLEKTLLGFKNKTAFKGRINVGGAAVSQNLITSSANPNVHFLPSPSFDESEREFWTFKS